MLWRTIRLGHGLHGVIEQCAVVAVEGAAEVVQKRRDADEQLPLMLTVLLIFFCELEPLRERALSAF